MFADCCLGLRDPDPCRLAQHVRLAPDDLEPELVRVPKDWQLGHAWDGDDLGNRELGLCGPAAVVHWCNLMAKVAGINRVFGRAEAERIYRVMGWDGTWAGDDGVVLLDLMYRWMLEPFCEVVLDGFFVVGHADDTHVAAGVGISPLIVGATLTRACKDSQIWNAKVADRSQRIWGGHAYLYHSDSPGGGNGASWGRPIFTTRDFRRARWNEAYLPICQALMPGLGLARTIRIARQL